MNRAYKYLKLTMNQNMKLEFRKKDMKRESEFKKQLYFSFSLSQFQFSSHGVRQHPWGAPLSALQSGAFLASHSGCNPVPTCLMEHHGCCGSPGR